MSQFVWGLWTSLLWCKFTAHNCRPRPKEVWNTWHQIFPIKVPMICLWNNPSTLAHFKHCNDIKTCGALICKCCVRGYKTVCFPTARHIRRRQRCSLVPFLTQNTPLNSIYALLCWTHLTAPPTLEPTKAFKNQSAFSFFFFLWVLCARILRLGSSVTRTFMDLFPDARHFRFSLGLFFSREFRNSFSCCLL